MPNEKSEPYKTLGDDHPIKYIQEKEAADREMQKLEGFQRNYLKPQYDYGYTLHLTEIAVNVVGPKKMAINAALINTSDWPMRFTVEEMNLVAKGTFAGVPINVPGKDMVKQTGILGRGMSAQIQHPPFELDLKQGANHIKMVLIVRYGHPDHAPARLLHLGVGVMLDYKLPIQGRPPVESHLSWGIEMQEEDDLGSKLGRMPLLKNDHKE